MRFKKGSKVEVLRINDEASGAWHPAQIISGNGHTYYVRYNKYAGVNGETERVSRKAMRPCPPPWEGLESLVPGEVVEVYEKCSWKMASFLMEIEENNALVRLLGSSMEFIVRKCNIRVPQTWQDYEWIIIQKGRSGEDHKHDKLRSQVRRTKIRIKLDLKDDETNAEDKFDFQENLMSSSKILKKRCCSPIDIYTSATKKSREIEKNEKLDQALTINPFGVPELGDAVAFTNEKMGKDYINGSISNKRLGFSEADKESGNELSVLGCSFAQNTESNDDVHSVTSSVASCSMSSNNFYNSSHHISSGPVGDVDGYISDAESFCWSGNQDGVCYPPVEEELEDEIHRLELHAYFCTLEALYASGPLSWEQETFMTNLRLSLHITNDEHLMQLKHLISIVKVGIPEFLNGIGKRVEAHVPKLESEIGDLHKKISIPCKHRKLILKYTNKYRLGLWRSRPDSAKV